MILKVTTRAITEGRYPAAHVTVVSSPCRLIIPRLNTRPTVPPVMKEISKRKGITMVERVAQSNKIRIAVVAAVVVIESQVVIFDV